MLLLGLVPPCLPTTASLKLERCVSERSQGISGKRPRGRCSPASLMAQAHSLLLWLSPSLALSPRPEARSLRFRLGSCWAGAVTDPPPCVAVSCGATCPRGRGHGTVPDPLWGFWLGVGAEASKRKRVPLPSPLPGAHASLGVLVERCGPCIHPWHLWVYTNLNMIWQIEIYKAPSLSLLLLPRNSESNLTFNIETVQSCVRNILTFSCYMILNFCVYLNDSASFIFSYQQLQILWKRRQRKKK